MSLQDKSLSKDDFTFNLNLVKEEMCVALHANLPTIRNINVESVQVFKLTADLTAIPLRSAIPLKNHPFSFLL